MGPVAAIFLLRLFLMSEEPQFALSPDGEHLAVGTHGTTVGIVDRTGRQVGVLVSDDGFGTSDLCSARMTACSPQPPPRGG